MALSLMKRSKGIEIVNSTPLPSGNYSRHALIHELNRGSPDEYLNCDLKADVHNGKPARSKEKFKKKVTSHMGMLKIDRSAWHRALRIRKSAMPHSR
jgi:hypothetical protein